MRKLIKNIIKENGIALGYTLNYPCAELIECIGGGWDWVWVDGQHGQLDFKAILDSVRVTENLNIASIVRAPSHEYGMLGRIADMNASGVMVPMVDNGEQARNIVDALRFPPLGRRSFGSRRIIDVSGAEYVHHSNEEMLVIAQIETPEGMENIEHIVNTEGIDVVFFSAEDMKLRRGLHVDADWFAYDALCDYAELLAKEAHKAGKYAGIIAPSVNLIKKAIDWGYTLIAAGGTHDYIARQAEIELSTLRTTISGIKVKNQK